MQLPEASLVGIPEISIQEKQGMTDKRQTDIISGTQTAFGV